MIESVELTNFQTHRKLKVDVGPGITTIVGPTDVGKSSILRAIRWLCLNQPRGSSFVRHGEKNGSCGMVVDGRKIVRDKNKGYIVDESEYNAVGSSIPEPVQDLLKISDLNFQTQHDAPFWFSETPGQVAKRLNEIVDLSIMDRCIGNAKKRARQTKAAVQVIADEISLLEEKGNQLKWVDEASEKLEKLHSHRRKWETNFDESERIRGIANSFQRAAKDLARSGRNMDKLELLLAQIIEDRELWSKMIAESSRIAQMAESGKLNAGLIEGLKIKNRACSRQLATTEKAMNDWMAAEASADDFQNGLLKLKACQNQNAKALAELQETKDRLSDIEICPTCQRPLGQ